MRLVALRTGRIRDVPLESTAPVVAFTWTPGGRLAYFGPTLPLGGRSQPTSVFAIRLSGAGRTQLFTLPYEERRGLWATNLAWQP